MARELCGYLSVRLKNLLICPLELSNTQYPTDSLYFSRFFKVACTGLSINTIAKKDNVVSSQDSTVLRTLTYVFTGLFVLFIAMIAVARVIAY